MAIAEFAEVLAAARAGNGDAVAVLWRELHPRLVRYLRGMEPSVAEDLESETWLQAARDLHAFDGNEVEFRAWLFTIARHRLIDWRRSSMRRPSTAVVPDELPEPAAEDDAEREALRRIDTDEAVALVRTLSPDQAEVILLRVLAGLDVERVAKILGKRSGTVRVLQHRGLRRLGDVLAERQADSGVTR